MAKTLLNATNEVLKRVNEIAGDAGLLTTLTDSARQHVIDIAIQVVNEGIVALYATTDIAQPQEQKEGTLTLATGTREYTLATDLVQLRFPFIDRTNGQYITEYPGSYDDMLILDLHQDFTGLPRWGKISPVNSKLHLDRAPTSVENGRAYIYQYDKSLLMTSASDTVPFSDSVFAMMVGPWAQLWKREMRNEFDVSLYRDNIGVAGRLMTQVQPRESYSPRG
jgi:hypothetical protein